MKSSRSKKNNQNKRMAASVHEGMASGVAKFRHSYSHSKRIIAFVLALAMVLGLVYVDGKRKEARADSVTQEDATSYQATDETLAGSHNEVSTDWEQFLKNVTDYGFELGYSRKFVGRTLENDPPMNDEEMIFFNKKNGMILYTQSYNGKSVNSAVVYCEVIEPKEWLPHDKWDVLWGCSSSHNGDGFGIFVHGHHGFIKGRCTAKVHGGNSPLIDFAGHFVGEGRTPRDGALRHRRILYRCGTAGNRQQQAAHG